MTARTIWWIDNTRTSHSDAVRAMSAGLVNSRILTTQDSHYIPPYPRTPIYTRTRVLLLK